MLNDPELKPDIEEHMIEINEYILLWLYKTIFSNKIQSKKEYEVYCKIQSL